MMNFSEFSAYQDLVCCHRGQHLLGLPAPRPHHVLPSILMNQHSQQ
jgi:hypothetical protein